MVARELDQIVVIDVEATCWKGAPPSGEEAEIIEIGICTLAADTGERLERESILVKPERSKISPFCTELTTLTQEQVDAGIPFAEACVLLKKKFHTRDRLWASYGDFDRKIFESQCRTWGVPYPFGATHLNIKTLFALAYQLRHETGMDGALQLLGYPLEGVHHRGGDDAWNIARILAELLLRLRLG